MYVNAKLRKILHETVLSYFKWLDPFRDPDEDEKILGCAPLTSQREKTLLQSLRKSRALLSRSLTFSFFNLSYFFLSFVSAHCFQYLDSKLQGVRGLVKGRRLLRSTSAVRRILDLRKREKKRERERGESICDLFFLKR